MDGGGGVSSGGTYRLDGTVGQADAGESSGGNYTLSGGFWAGVPCSLPQAAAAAVVGGIEFTWDGGTFDVYRAVDSPYFSGGTQIGFGESSGWIYDEAQLGDPSQNAFYLVGASAACGKRLGEFDFALEPGT